jgi:hypothetical protein
MAGSMAESEAANDAALARGMGDGAPPPTANDAATTPTRAAALPAMAMATRAFGETRDFAARGFSVSATERDVDDA